MLTNKQTLLKTSPCFAMLCRWVIMQVICIVCGSFV